MHAHMHRHAHTQNEPSESLAMAGTCARQTGRDLLQRWFAPGATPIISAPTSRSNVLTFRGVCCAGGKWTRDRDFERQGSKGGPVGKLCNGDAKSELRRLIKR